MKPLLVSWFLACARHMMIWRVPEAGALHLEEKLQGGPAAARAGRSSPAAPAAGGWRPGDGRAWRSGSGCCPPNMPASRRRGTILAQSLSPACTADPRVGHCVSEHERLPSSREETAPFSSFIYCCERGIFFFVIFTSETASEGPLYVPSTTWKWGDSQWCRLSRTYMHVFLSPDTRS
jgi:hypothetical protein